MTHLKTMLIRWFILGCGCVKPTGVARTSSLLGVLYFYNILIKRMIRIIEAKGFGLTPCRLVGRFCLSPSFPPILLKLPGHLDQSALASSCLHKNVTGRDILANEITGTPRKRPGRVFVR